MAASRDQAARVLRQEAAEQAGGNAAIENSALHAEQPRGQMAEEAKRRYVIGDPYYAPIVDDFAW